MAKDAAMKALSVYAQKNNLNETARLTYGGRLIAISGAAGVPPHLKASTINAWNAMLSKHGVRQVGPLPPHNCAEAHLWLMLVEDGQFPRRLDIWTGKLGRKNQIKLDSTCPNCNQWVYKEFRSFNST